MGDPGPNTARIPRSARLAQVTSSSPQRILHADLKAAITLSVVNWRLRIARGLFAESGGHYIGSSVPEFVFHHLWQTVSTN